MSSSTAVARAGVSRIIPVGADGGWYAHPTRGLSVGGAAAADVFRWVFAAAWLFLAIALVALLLMEERPLRGRSDDIAPPVA